jgi:archaellin
VNKKAEMGIGTLIIFISLLLVAAIAAGVLIQTAGSLQEKALSTGDQAKGQIATNAKVIEVSASDGRAGSVKYFTSIVKLASGSDPIKLSQVLLTMNTYDMTATLQFTNDGDTTNSFDGYYTLSTDNYTYTTSAVNLTDDIDEDSLVDFFEGDGSSGGHVFLNLSSQAANIDLGNCSGGVHTDAPSSGDYIISAALVCSADNVQQVSVTPKSKGSGVFSVEYLQTGSNFVSGNLQRGDVIKVYYEAPRAVGEDESVRLNFIPKIGTPTLTEFITPEVISEERIYLYP